MVYRDPAQPLRNLTVFDGLQTIQQGDPPLTIRVSGFTTPLTGPVRTSVGLVAYEGDRGSVGDRLALNGRLLSDAANPGQEPVQQLGAFEGTDTLSQRIPAYVNGLGFDCDRVVADGCLGERRHQHVVRASTTLDQYLIQVVTFTTGLSTPRLVVGKSVADLNGGDVQPGDVLRYTVTTLNSGDDAATGVRVQDAVPPQTTLVPGSGGDAAGDSRSVAFDLGTLATAGSASVAFDVVVDAGAPDGFVIGNTATATGLGATAGRPVSDTSPVVQSIVRRPPFDAALTVTPQRPVAGEPAVGEVEVTNDLGRPIRDAVLTVEIPAADVLSAAAPKLHRRGRRAVPRRHARPGEQASVRVRLRPFDQGRLRPVVTARGEGVARQRSRWARTRQTGQGAAHRPQVGRRGRRPTRAARHVPDRCDRASPRGGRAESARLRPAGSRPAVALRLARRRAARRAGLLAARQAPARPQPTGNGGRAGDRLLGGRPQRCPRPQRQPARPGPRRQHRPRALAPRSPEACPADSRPRAYAAC